MIQEIASKTTSKDPMEIAEWMMSHPKLPMLGCQHAYIAAGALLAALKNEGLKKLSIACQFQEKHPHGCREEKCPYFK